MTTLNDTTVDTLVSTQVEARALRAAIADFTTHMGSSHEECMFLVSAIEQGVNSLK